MNANREGGAAMAVIQFESVAEGNMIRIPEEYEARPSSLDIGITIVTTADFFRHIKKEAIS